MCPEKVGLTKDRERSSAASCRPHGVETGGGGYFWLGSGHTFPNNEGSDGLKVENRLLLSPETTDGPGENVAVLLPLSTIKI